MSDHHLSLLSVALTRGTFGLIATIAMLVGVAIAIAVFERPRAKRIESDLRADARREARRTNDEGDA